MSYLNNYRILILLAILLCAHRVALAAGAIKIAIDAEFSIPLSTSAQAVRNGAQVAVREINAAGGVLGRQLEVIERDNRAVPARALNNLRELAADPDVVAVLAGRYSPVVVESLDEIHRLRLPLLVPWAAADPITDHNHTPSYVFRLSLRDSWALQVMMQHALASGARKVGLLLPNTDWGRSSQKAAEATARGLTRQEILGSRWYNWGDTSLIEHYQALLSAGAQALIFVANDREAVVLVNEMGRLPAAQRIPVVAHWGMTGGQFFEQAGGNLKSIDLSVVQTYSFIGKTDALTRRVLAGLQPILGTDDPRKLPAPVGVAQAYDLVQLLARAIRQANSTDRTRVRDALENLGPYTGLLGRLDKPFTARRHEALSLGHVFMARYAEDGALEPIGKAPK